MMDLYTRNHVFKKFAKRHHIGKYLKFQKGGKQSFQVLSIIRWFHILFEIFTLFCDLLGVPLEEEEEEEEDTSWTGKLRALVYKIKGPPKPEKEKPTEEEERRPSKCQCLSILILPQQGALLRLD